MKTPHELTRWRLLPVLLILASAIVSTLALPTSPTVPTVQVQQGTLQGTIMATDSGKQYQAFRGIPYAKPPIGDLRFAKPVPHPGFQGVFNASHFGPTCIQVVPELFSPQGLDTNLYSEDCLTLNVFVPMSPDASTTTQGKASSQSQTYSVLIFIHGGGFIQGSAATYEAGNLVTGGDVIVVTLQYRIGVMGFLSTGDSTLPGNYGLWDQNMAIRWVKDNIAAFGGDPNAITISGESAGSASVSFQSLSPHSKGLFQKAIQYSGTATSSWALTRNPRLFSSALGQKLGCTVPPSVHSMDQDVMALRQEFLQCLRRVSPENLVLSGIFNRSVAWQMVDFVFVPYVDGDFVPDEPLNMLKDTQYLQQIGFYDRDYLTGVVNNDGGLLFGTGVQQWSQGDAIAVISKLQDPDFFDQGLVEAFLIQRFGETSPAMEAATSFFYTYPRFPNVSKLDISDLFDAQGDVAFYVPLLEFARAVAVNKQQGRRNLVYYFNHYPKYMTGTGLEGVLHGFDLIYLFDTAPFAAGAFGNLSLWNTDDDWLTSAYRSICTDFVKSSEPTVGLRPEFTDDWVDFETVNESYLSLSPHNATVQRHLLARRASFWLDLLPKLRSLSTNGTADSVHTGHAFLQSPIMG